MPTITKTKRSQDSLGGIWPPIKSPADRKNHREKAKITIITPIADEKIRSSINLIADWTQLQSKAAVAQILIKNR